MSAVQPPAPAVIEAAQAGDRDALARVMAILDRFLRLLVARHKPAWTEFDDSLQDARLWTLEALPFYDRSQGTLPGWIARRVRCRFTDQFRRLVAGVRWPKEPPLELDAALSVPAEIDDLDLALARAFLAQVLAHVPPNDRERAALGYALSDVALWQPSIQQGHGRDYYSKAYRQWMERAQTYVGQEKATP